MKGVRIDHPITNDALEEAAAASKTSTREVALFISGRLPPQHHIEGDARFQRIKKTVRIPKNWKTVKLSCPRCNRDIYVRFDRVTDLQCRCRTWLNVTWQNSTWCLEESE